MIWILIAHPQHYLSIVSFKVFQVCRFHAAKSQTQNLCWRCNIFLKAISCWSNGDYQVLFIRCDECQQNTGLVINYFKPSNLQYFIQNCGSLWMHICLSMCLLPTWMHVWAFLQSLLLNFFFCWDFKPSFDFFLSSISQRKSLIGKVISSGHQWTDTWFIHIPCPNLAFPVSYRMHAGGCTSVCSCVPVVVLSVSQRQGGEKNDDTDRRVKDGST